MNGKGDRPRPVDWEKYTANYEAIFRQKKPAKGSKVQKPHKGSKTK